MISLLDQANDFREKILLYPILQGADHLRIVSGYATHTMASWHIAEIKERFGAAVDIDLIVGMCGLDGLSRSVHEGFKEIMRHRQTTSQSRLTCKYIVEGRPVHTKLYLWEKGGNPFCAYMGSANYTQPAFLGFRREAMEECDPEAARDYLETLEPDTIYCNHAEVEDKVIITRTHPVLETEEAPAVSLHGAGVQNVTLSLLARGGETGRRSGLNWGQRDGREPNQAYIPLPASVARSSFFPLGRRQFSVLTDDGMQLILRVEQQNDKAITTPLNNSQIGEYFRRRIGVANGAYVSRSDLEHYGRTNVVFYKLDEEQFFMDFSV